MSIRQVLKRLEALEKVQTKHDDGFMLEELFRPMWRRDRKGYLKLASEKGSFTAFLATQFEREDADRGLRQGRTR
jgi:hypothetical protein